MNADVNDFTRRVGGTDQSGERQLGIEPVLDRHADTYWYYGSGKLALRDAVRSMLPSSVGIAADRPTRRGVTLDRSSDTRWNVLLPAYVPDAVAEPLRELGVEPRYYAIRPALEPDEGDLVRRTDDGTIAIVSIDYFGFPQPGLDTVADHAREIGCYHVDDNAHATLSVADGRLLGTLGDAGITSLWKTFPIPNGAVLYVTNDGLRDRFEPSSLAGVSSEFVTADAQFVCAQALKRTLQNRPGLRRSVAPILQRVYGADVPAPKTRYEAAKRPCSKLSALVCARTDPSAVRDRRRRNYRAWLDILESIAGTRPLFADLPEGICPQCMPVETDRPAQVQSALTSAGLDDIHTWPRLPPAVRVDPAYASAQYLAAHVLALPVDRRVDPETIASVGSSLAVG